MIRQATHEDMSRIVELGGQFLGLGPYAWVPLDVAAFEAFAAQLIRDGVIFLADDGLIGGCLYPFYFNPSVVMTAELFWYSPKNGRLLREALEGWARERGCAAITFSGLANEREATIRKLFQRADYQPTEVAFVKRFAA
jgi:hypothetical protein